MGRPAVGRAVFLRLLSLPSGRESLFAVLAVHNSRIISRIMSLEQAFWRQGRERYSGIKIGALLPH